MFKGMVEIYCDGGCTNNGAADATAYGSYILRAKDGERVIKQTHSGRLDYPQHHTNNAAEIQTFIEALSHLTPGDYRVIVLCDSQLVVNWLNGLWQCNASHLVPLVQQARDIAAQFPALEVLWVRREQIVRQLGH